MYNERWWFRAEATGYMWLHEPMHACMSACMGACMQGSVRAMRVCDPTKTGAMRVYGLTEDWCHGDLSHEDWCHAGLWSHEDGCHGDLWFHESWCHAGLWFHVNDLVQCRGTIPCKDGSMHGDLTMRVCGSMKMS